ncbi:hypothetical protein LPJ66_005214 [Kickxella alabastrina]|uniref:Uncharacterized protein n=1 Tax=Kickxella alabastrina TaxID=61397 RepID=A0ACC1IMU3_9FUNG|nr:hypothetical protein LPJ66_005214 [Kickxella alabastrina]
MKSVASARIIGTIAMVTMAATSVVGAGESSISSVVATSVEAETLSVAELPASSVPISASSTISPPVSVPQSKEPVISSSSDSSSSSTSSKPNDARGASANFSLQGSIGALAIAVCGLAYF